ncbi:hypothetical protein JWV37_01100 [Sulfurospirillum sp. T05]|uniref:Uncharacterized protein n=1 Tax=Sulfurospirillum tamanense TaxID=2813362 RepID=A0ABS2WP78_9BACT|nr:hypothetical protein [Sulfurospirillum tamanensis]MBN2963365.1 hypothetical protein [Sulfurospirillum tamanensis]
MKSIKEVVENYEVTRATLHNWKKTKPRLYKLLRTDNDDQLRELLVVLSHYAQTLTPCFTCKEVEQIVLLELNFKDTKSVLEIEYLFLEKMRNEPLHSLRETMPLFTKLSSLNPVEKYLLKRALQSVQAKREKKEPLEPLIEHYFKGFVFSRQ